MSNRSNNARPRNPHVEVDYTMRNLMASYKTHLNDLIEIIGDYVPVEGEEPLHFTPAHYYPRALYHSASVFQSLMPEVVPYLKDGTGFILDQKLPLGGDVTLTFTANDEHPSLHSIAIFGPISENAKTVLEPLWIPNQGEKHDPQYLLHYMSAIGMLSIFPQREEVYKYLAGAALANVLLDSVYIKQIVGYDISTLNMLAELTDNRNIHEAKTLVDPTDPLRVTKVFARVIEYNGMLRQGFEDMMHSNELKLVFSSPKDLNVQRRYIEAVNARDTGGEEIPNMPTESRAPLLSGRIVRKSAQQNNENETEMSKKPAAPVDTATTPAAEEVTKLSIAGIDFDTEGLTLGAPEGTPARDFARASLQLQEALQLERRTYAEDGTINPAYASKAPGAVETKMLRVLDEITTPSVRNLACLGALVAVGGLVALSRR